jgi:hypothetical protein
MLQSFWLAEKKQMGLLAVNQGKVHSQWFATTEKPHTEHFISRSL